MVWVDSQPLSLFSPKRQRLIGFWEWFPTNHVSAGFVIDQRQDFSVHLKRRQKIHKLLTVKYMLLFPKKTSEDSKNYRKNYLYPFRFQFFCVSTAVLVRHVFMNLFCFCTLLSWLQICISKASIFQVCSKHVLAAIYWWDKRFFSFMHFFSLLFYIFQFPRSDYCHLLLLCHC